MKIKCRISKLANQFFFISTLAAWHHSCRKEDREEWLRMTGKLSAKEEKALISFSRLMQTKYGFQYKGRYLGEIFYKHTEQTAWPALKKFAEQKEDYVLIKDIFSLFGNRFEKAWKKRRMSSLKILENELQKEKNIEFFNAIASLFDGKKAATQSVNLIIIFSPLGNEQTAAGGAKISGKFYYS